MHRLSPRHISIIGVAAGLVLLASAGCEPGPSVSSANASTEQATVKGTVTLKDVALPEGTIIFDAANVSRKVGPSKATLAKDGGYTIKTFIGENRIIVESPKVKNQDAYTEYTFDVKPGENTFDFMIPKRDLKPATP